MKKLFLDTNILMDAVECRKNGLEANVLLDMSRNAIVSTCATTMSFATMSYLLRDHSKEDIHKIFTNLIDALEIIPVEAATLSNAMAYGPVRDFEDLLQYQCAIAAECDVIITNNKRDFVEFCQLPLMTAQEYLLQYDSEN